MYGEMYGEMSGEIAVGSAFIHGVAMTESMHGAPVQASEIVFSGNKCSIDWHVSDGESRRLRC